MGEGVSLLDVWGKVVVLEQVTKPWSVSSPTTNFKATCSAG